MDTLRWLNPGDQKWYTVSAERRGAGRRYWYLRSGSRRIYLGPRPTAQQLERAAGLE